jgi:uncharacterized protein (TIGR00299 family) protein
MTKIAYFDCFSGCSGDMILGALLDADLSLETLRSGLAQLNLRGYAISQEKVRRSSIAASKFNVALTEEQHHHRSLSDILALINGSGLSESVKTKASDIFRRLGKVEAEIHGRGLEEVHFHELGAVDSIIDIVGTVYAIENLGIESIYCSALPAGDGTVKTAHGILPSPAPATLQLLADARAPLVAAPEAGQPTGELVTPTGAVLMTSLARFSRPDMCIMRAGYGAGSKEFKNWPNILRVWIGEADEHEADTGKMVLLETNIDDMNSQIYGYLMEQLFEARAADVWFTPIQMKKNRPAVMLSVLCPAELETRLTEIIMRETSTLGIRSREVSRHTAQREQITVETELGTAAVKIKRTGEFIAVTPEYEDCRKIAREKGLPLQQVTRMIEIEARQRLKLSGT